MIAQSARKEKTSRQERCGNTGGADSVKRAALLREYSASAERAAISDLTDQPAGSSTAMLISDRLNSRGQKETALNPGDTSS